MDRIQKPNTAYQDDSQADHISQPPFTAGAARRARQVVALPSGLLRPVRQLWASLGTGAYRKRLLGVIVLVALAGGAAGVILGVVNNSQAPGIDAEELAVGADAKAQSDNRQPISSSKEPKRMSQPSDSKQRAEFESLEMDRLVTELQKRRSPSRAKKAYRVATIYPSDGNDSHRERKRGKKH